MVPLDRARRCLKRCSIRIAILVIWGNLISSLTACGVKIVARGDVDRAYLKANRIFHYSGVVLRDDLEGLDLVRDMVDQIQCRGDGSTVAINLHRNAWAIDLICPGAKIVHVVRDPRDVARSSIGMGWYGFAYFGVDHWIKTENAWDRAASGLAADRWL